MFTRSHRALDKFHIVSLEETIDRFAISHVWVEHGIMEGTITKQLNPHQLTHLPKYFSSFVWLKANLCASANHVKIRQFA